jgi:mRNA-degrading endonuclease toxin of MazEF toxin-antitoxin module
VLSGQYPAGGVYYISDHLLKLPGDSGGGRKQHPQRPVLVVSDQNEENGTNAAPANVFPVVWIVPLSTSSTGRTRFDIPVAAGDGNLPQKCWARVPALQLVDKANLGTFLGVVKQETLDAVTAQILRFLGIIPPDSNTEASF